MITKHTAAPCKTCRRGLWDETCPGITFDDAGESNYSRMFDRLLEAYPRGRVGRQSWDGIVRKIRQSGRGRQYDCVIGVSGGTDSSYLLHLAKESGLRPLAVNFDNGWNSEIAVTNIKKVTSALSIDLETYVVDYEEMKDVLRAYMRASLPWIDAPTDLAIQGCLYRVASLNRIKYILRGSDFRSEGVQPREWSYSDGKQLRAIHRQYGTRKLKTFPHYTMWTLLYFAMVRKIKTISPFLFVEYDKKSAQQMLEERFGWKYYGGHHHENVFTRFAIAYWLPRKFDIDKRKITLSAQILSKQISRDEALLQLDRPPYDASVMERDKEYAIKKLDISDEEFERLMQSKNRCGFDYPSYYPLIRRFSRLLGPMLVYMFAFKPTSLFQIEMRDAA